MYFTPLVLAAATTSATTGLPFIKPPSFDLGVPIQAFGVIVAAGVLIGAAILRRYAEWHGVSDDHIRGITGWITVTGFIGAHVFDVLAYEPHKLDEEIAMWPPSQWPVLLRLWDGISSYGGFIGGAAGFAFYVWWKRLPARLFADIAIVGLLPAFSIGRIGCTVVSDHVGAMVDPDKWYAFLAMEYPTSFNNAAVRELVESLPAGARPEYITAWNLGFVEFLYLVPVNALILWLAFRPDKRTPAGFITVLTGVLYAPVRFFLDFLRPETTDKLHAGLTFAQWSSILAFGASIYVAAKILKSGKPAETVTRTSKEAQERLKILLKDEDEATGSVDKPKTKGTVEKMTKDKPKTENVVADAKVSPSNEEPADDGAEVDPKDALDARKAESSIADKSVKSDDKKSEDKK